MAREVRGCLQRVVRFFGKRTQKLLNGLVPLPTSVCILLNYEERLCVRLHAA